MDEAGRIRDKASDLIARIEATTEKLAAMPVLPIDLLDRYERALVQAHAANLVRLPQYFPSEMSE